MDSTLSVNAGRWPVAVNREAAQRCRMDYICIHSIDGSPSIDGLARLPKSIEWRLFRSKRHRRLFLDHGFDQSSAWDVEHYAHHPNFRDGPFWNPASLKFDAAHAFLNELSRQPLMAEQMARPVIKYALLVSALVQGPVFFSIADSQGHDSVCQAENGRLLRLTYCAGEEIVTVGADGAVSTRPNPYRSEDEGTLEAGLTFDESVRHFGYRLACLDEVAIDSPQAEPDEYELVAHSTLGKRRRYNGFEVAWQLVRLLWRQPV